MRETFRAHASGETILPDEAYLGWTNPRGEQVRSLNMPGYVGTAAAGVAGTKIINSNPHNPRHGLPRASGLTVLYDTTTTRVVCLMESAHVSALRTAAVSVLAIRLCAGRPAAEVAVLGAGVLARAHVQLLAEHVRGLREVRLYDLDGATASRLRDDLDAPLAARGIAVRTVGGAEAAVRGADLVIPATTTTTGYIPHAWLKPGCVLVHVSLDDAMPDVVLNAGKVIVDDWPLVRADPRRLLGRMYRAGQLVGPDGDAADGDAAGARRVDAELGDLVVGRKRGREHDDEIVLVNPFGLAIEDVCLASRVYARARELGLGVSLEH